MRKRYLDVRYEDWKANPMRHLEEARKMARSIEGVPVVVRTYEAKRKRGATFTVKATVTSVSNNQRSYHTDINLSGRFGE